MALTVAQLTARLTADTSNFFKAMSIADAAMFRTGSIAKRVGAGVGIAVLGMGAMSLRAAGNFEESMHVLGAVSGATGLQLKDLQAQAIALGKDMKLPNVSAKDAADAMTELSKAGLSVNDIMKATRGVLQLGVAANMDFKESSTIVARALTAFRMEGSKATQVADLLTATANKTTADINDMALGVQMASAQFHAARFDIDDLTTSLGLMANAGIAGSDAGTSLKTMMNRLTAPTQTAKDKMKELGFEVYNSSGQVKKMPNLIQDLSKALAGQSTAAKNAALYTIFGSDAIRAARVMLSAGADGWNKLNMATTKGGEAQAFAEARTKGFNGAVQAFISQVETLAIEIGLKMLPAATDAARALANFVGSLDAGAITSFFGVISNVVQVLWNVFNSSELVRNTLIGLVAAFGVVKFVINPLIGVVTSLTTAFTGLGAAATFIAANPIAAFIAGAAMLTFGMNILTQSLRDTAFTADMVAASLQRARDASLALEQATNQVSSAELNLKVAQSERKSALAALNNIESQHRNGLLTGTAYTQQRTAAVQRLERADLGLKQAKTGLKSAIDQEGKAVQSSVKEYNTSISQARERVNQAQRLAQNFGYTKERTRELKDATADYNNITTEAIKYGRDHEKAIGDIAKKGGPAAKEMQNFAKTIGDFKLQTGTKRLQEFQQELEAQGPKAGSAAAAIGQSISQGIAQISADPAVQAARSAVRQAIEAGKAEAKTGSPSKLAADEIGGPIATGIAQGIRNDSWQAALATQNMVGKAVYSGKVWAAAGARTIAKGFTAAMAVSIAQGTGTLPEKLDKSIKQMVGRAKATLDAAKPGFDKWFSRLQDRALRAFDAVTQKSLTPSEVLAKGKTSSETALEGETTSEKLLRELDAKRTADEQKARQDEANATISAYAAKRAAILRLTRNEGESELEFRERQAEELKRLNEEKAAAQKVLDDVAYEQKRATLEKDAALERQNLEKSAAIERADLERKAEEERLNWEARRENERIALEDRLAALQANLLAGKVKVKNINAEILKILNAYGAPYKQSGELLGVEFAAGLIATKKKVVGAAKQIAKAIQNILKLSSPAKEGPLSTLDTWWEPFSKTLLQGMDENAVKSAVRRSVSPGSIAVSPSSPSGGTTINLTVTDSTFAGMSREQADRVARDIKAALDRQVTYSI